MLVAEGDQPGAGTGALVIVGTPRAPTQNKKYPTLDAF